MAVGKGGERGIMTQEAKHRRGRTPIRTSIAFWKGVKVAD
jgi:hypothetical protein